MLFFLFLIMANSGNRSKGSEPVMVVEIPPQTVFNTVTVITAESTTFTFSAFTSIYPGTTAYMTMKSGLNLTNNLYLIILLILLIAGILMAYNVKPRKIKIQNGSAIYCVYCGYKNPYYAKKYCVKCGERLQKTSLDQ
jgi:hypothetical protein